MDTLSSPPAFPILPEKIILTSTKAYFTPSRTLTYLESLLSPENKILPLGSTTSGGKADQVEVKDTKSRLLFGLIPDFLTIHPCASLLTSRYGPPQAWPLSLGAQDCFWEVEQGAYTGEIVPSALQSLGVSIVELGHAERRRLLGENDHTTAKKARAVAASGMIPLVCVGEVARPDSKGPLSKAVGDAVRELTPQIESLLNAVPSEAPVIFAYEPIWAIGAASPAGVDYIAAVVQALRTIIAKTGRGGQTKIVYGGSAGPGLWSGKADGGNGLARFVDGMFLGRFAHEIGGVKAVIDEAVESLAET